MVVRSVAALGHFGGPGSICPEVCIQLWRKSCCPDLKPPLLASGFVSAGEWDVLERETTSQVTDAEPYGHSEGLLCGC